MEVRKDRKKDRHQLTAKQRRCLQTLRMELTNRNWSEKLTTENQSPNLTFRLQFMKKVVDDFSGQSYIDIDKSFSFFLEHHPTEEDWRFIILINQRKQQLIKYLLNGTSKQIIKLLSHLDFKQSLMKDWTNPTNYLETIKKIPVSGIKYGSPDYRVKKKVSQLLTAHGQFGIKTDHQPVADFDLHLLPEYLQPILKRKLGMLINKEKIGFYGLSEHQSTHLFFTSRNPLSQTTIYYRGKETNYQSVKIGDFKAKGGYVIAPFSKNRDIVTTKWWKNTSLQRARLHSDRHRDQMFSRFGFYFASSPLHSNNQLKKPIFKSQFISSTLGKNEDLSNWNYRKELKKSVQILCILKIHLSSQINQKNTTASRASQFHKVFYRETGQQKESSFLVDQGWRKNDYQRLSDGNPYLDLSLMKGRYYHFLERVY